MKLKNLNCFREIRAMSLEFLIYFSLIRQKIAMGFPYFCFIKRTGNCTHFTA